MVKRAGETWRFQVHCPGAERVYLVREPELGPSAWVEMQPAGLRGEWYVTQHLVPGSYRFRYFRNDGKTYVNCGNHGLMGERLDAEDPAVSVESLAYAVPA